MRELWVDKYRPDTLEGYVFQNENEKRQIETWINEKHIPHLLLSGPPGTGKTTLAKILINMVEVDPYDIKIINASRDNGVDYIRETIEGFVQTMPFGDFKVVLLDEADYLSLSAQATLRGLMEKYSNTARFILTCNLPNKIMGALHSRTQGFHLSKIDQTEFTARVAEILISENIEFELETLDTYVKSRYPDLRKCINSVQENNIGGQLLIPEEKGLMGSDSWRVATVDLMKAKKYAKARELLCASVRPEEMEEVFKWMYNNLELWGDDDEKQDKAILIIRDGLVNHALVSDPEINLAATFIELTQA